MGQKRPQPRTDEECAAFLRTYLAGGRAVACEVVFEAGYKKGFSKAQMGFVKKSLPIISMWSIPGSPAPAESSTVESLSPLRKRMQALSKESV